MIVIETATYVVGFALVLSGLEKLSDRRLAARALRSALANVVPGRLGRSTMLWRGIATVELLLAAALLWGSAWSWLVGGLGATLFLGGAAGYSAYAARAGSDCGCTRWRHVPTKLSTAGAGAMACIAAVTALMATSDHGATRSVWQLVIALGLAAVAFTAMGARGSVHDQPSASARADGDPVPECATKPWSLAMLSHALTNSELWRVNQRYLLSSHPDDVWREACWGFLAFPAERAGKALTAVFAVDLSPDEGHAVAFVDEPRAEIVAGHLTESVVA